MSSSPHFIPVDPNVATRQQFTDNLCNAPIPSNASRDWRDIATKLQSILQKLGYHEAMAPNLQQTYMTPANSKNRVYFMWDFIGRTLGYLYMLPPEVSMRDTTDPKCRELWSDIISRNVLAGALIIDDKPGMLNQTMESTYPDQRGQHPEFGDDILREARVLFNGE